MASVESHRPGVAEVAGRSRLDRRRRLEIQDAGPAELERARIGVGKDVREQRGALRAQHLPARVLPARRLSAQRRPARLRQNRQRAIPPAVGQRRVRLHEFVQTDRAVAQRQAVAVDIGMIVEARETQFAQESQVR